MLTITDEIIEGLLNGDVVREDVELSEDDKKHLFGKAKDFTREAEYYETYEKDDQESAKLYNIASKLYELGSD